MGLIDHYEWVHMAVELIVKQSLGPLIANGLQKFGKFGRCNICETCEPEQRL